MSKVLIFGATSAIAQECARLWVKENCSLVLIGRDESRLNTLAKDLRVRGAKEVDVKIWDFRNLNDITSFVSELTKDADRVLLAHGILGQQDQMHSDSRLVEELFNINLTSSVVILNEVAATFAKKNSGQLAVITSVAGDRGRQSNYIYGASKAGLSVYTDGLAHRFANTPVQILNIKPGFVDTPMTADFKKGALWSKPLAIAERISKSLDGGKRGVVYTPGFWRWIMFIIKHVPTKIFWKTKL